MRFHKVIVCLLFSLSFCLIGESENGGNSFPFELLLFNEMEKITNKCGDFQFSFYQKLQVNESKTFEGIYFGNYPLPSFDIIFYTGLRTESFYIYYLITAGMHYSYIALYVDRNIKLTLEAIQENCEVILVNESGCKEGRLFSPENSVKDNEIRVQYSLNPIAETEYYLKETIPPYYRLIKISSKWENGTAARICKFKITTQEF